MPKPSGWTKKAKLADLIRALPIGDKLNRVALARDSGLRDSTVLAYLKEWQMNNLLVFYKGMVGWFRVEDGIDVSRRANDSAVALGSVLKEHGSRGFLEQRRGKKWSG